MQLAKRKLGFWMLSALVIGNMIGSGIFLLPAALASIGSISLIGWSITAVGALFLALVFARLSHLMPKTGGPYAYCHAAYGDFVGFQVAFSYWVALWVGNAGIAVATVGYLSVFFPSLAQSPHALLISTLAVLWFVTGLNVMGVALASVFQMITTILKLLPLLLIALVGVYYVQPELLSHSFNLSGVSNWHAINSSAAITMWAFIGLESATLPASSCENPERDIPRATIFGTLVAAIVYIASTFVIMGIVPNQELQFSHAPYAAAAAKLFGPWGREFIALGALIACLGALNGWVMLQGQIAMAAADNNLFPKVFARRNRAGSPAWALVISSGLITVLLCLRYTSGLVGLFTFTILLATLATLIPYLYSSVAEWLLIKKDKRSPWMCISTIAAFIYVVWAIAGVDMNVLYYGMLLIFASVPVYVWLELGKQNVQSPSTQLEQ